MDPPEAVIELLDEIERLQGENQRLLESATHRRGEPKKESPQG